MNRAIKQERTTPLRHPKAGRENEGADTAGENSSPSAMLLGGVSVRITHPDHMDVHERSAFHLEELLAMFTHSWFPRAARTTNDSLIQLSADLFMLKGFAREVDRQPDNAVSRASALMVLRKKGKREIRAALRIRGSADEKDKLKVARDDFVATWATMHRDLCQMR
jgi:hypothetical protein